MISVLKVKYYVVLVSSISNIFTNKTSLANKLMSFSSNNSALITKQRSRFYFFSFFKLDNHMKKKLQEKPLLLVGESYCTQRVSIINHNKLKFWWELLTYTRYHLSCFFVFSLLEILIFFSIPIHCQIY